MYKYPYNSAEIFFNLEENLSQNTRTIQGFEIVGNDLYFWPSGGLAGFWKYNFKTMKEEDLYGTGSGYHITANESYIFHDTDHSILVRYNNNSESVDMELDLHNLITGLALNKANLYTLVQEYDTDIFKLVKLDFSLNIIEETSFPQAC